MWLTGPVKRLCGDGVGAEWSESWSFSSVVPVAVSKQEKEGYQSFKSGFDWSGFDSSFLTGIGQEFFEVLRVVWETETRALQSWSAAFGPWYVVGG